MSTHNPNLRLETFCDGVIAIAITLLILEIKVPALDLVHSPSDLWKNIGSLWPSFFAFYLSFIAILIAWFNHHNLFKMIERSTSAFIFANGFLLLTIVVMPFPTAMVAEYMKTEYAQPAIVFYCVTLLFHNIAWNLLFYTTLKPNPLTDIPSHLISLKEGKKYCIYGFGIYTLVAALAWWFPMTALVINTVSWVGWLILGITYKKEVA